MPLSLQEAYNELAYYSLSHPSPDFIHQLVVDAFTVQTAGANNKPISVVFALAGLYLFVEEDYTGRQVQLAHMQMAKHKLNWPVLSLPANRGTIHITDVLSQAAGIDRDNLIYAWCRDVWEHCRSQRETIIAILQSCNIPSRV